MSYTFILIPSGSSKLKFTEILFNLFSLGMTGKAQARRVLAGWFVEF